MSEVIIRECYVKLKPLSPYEIKIFTEKCEENVSSKYCKDKNVSNYNFKKRSKLNHRVYEDYKKFRQGFLKSRKKYQLNEKKPTYKNNKSPLPSISNDQFDSDEGEPSFLGLPLEKSPINSPSHSLEDNIKHNCNRKPKNVKLKKFRLKKAKKRGTPILDSDSDFEDCMLSNSSKKNYEKNNNFGSDKKNVEHIENNSRFMQSNASGSNFKNQEAQDFYEKFRHKYPHLDAAYSKLEDSDISNLTQYRKNAKFNKSDLPKAPGTKDLSNNTRFDVVSKIIHQMDSSKVKPMKQSLKVSNNIPGKPNILNSMITINSKRKTSHRVLNQKFLTSKSSLGGEADEILQTVSNLIDDVCQDQHATKLSETKSNNFGNFENENTCKWCHTVFPVKSAADIFCDICKDMNGMYTEQFTSSCTKKKRKKNYVKHTTTSKNKNIPTNMLGKVLKKLSKTDKNRLMYKVNECKQNVEVKKVAKKKDLNCLKVQEIRAHTKNNTRNVKRKKYVIPNEGDKMCSKGTKLISGSDKKSMPDLNSPEYQIKTTNVQVKNTEMKYVDKGLYLMTFPKLDEEIDMDSVAPEISVNIANDTGNGSSTAKGNVQERNIAFQQKNETTDIIEKISLMSKNMKPLQPFISKAHVVVPVCASSTLPNKNTLHILPTKSVNPLQTLMQSQPTLLIRNILPKPKVAENSVGANYENPVAQCSSVKSVNIVKFPMLQNVLGNSQLTQIPNQINSMTRGMSDPHISQLNQSINSVSLPNKNIVSSTLFNKPVPNQQLFITVSNSVATAPAIVSKQCPQMSDLSNEIFNMPVNSNGIAPVVPNNIIKNNSIAQNSSLLQKHSNAEFKEQSSFSISLSEVVADHFDFTSQTNCNLSTEFVKDGNIDIPPLSDENFNLDANVPYKNSAINQEISSAVQPNSLSLPESQNFKETIAPMKFKIKQELNAEMYEQQINRTNEKLVTAESEIVSTNKDLSENNPNIRFLFPLEVSDIVKAAMQELEAISILGVLDLDDNYVQNLANFYNKELNEYNGLKNCESSADKNIAFDDLDLKIKLQLSKLQILTLAKKMLEKYGTFEKVAESIIGTSSSHDKELTNTSKSLINEPVLGNLKNEHEKSSCQFADVPQTEQYVNLPMPETTLIKVKAEKLSFSTSTCSSEELPSIETNLIDKESQELELTTLNVPVTYPSFTEIENPIPDFSTTVPSLLPFPTQVPTAIAPRNELINEARQTPSTGSGSRTPSRPESARSHVEDHVIPAAEIKRERLESTTMTSSCKKENESESRSCSFLSSNSNVTQEISTGMFPQGSSSLHNLLLQGSSSQQNLLLQGSSSQQNLPPNQTQQPTAMPMNNPQNMHNMFDFINQKQIAPQSTNYQIHQQTAGHSAQMSTVPAMSPHQVQTASGMQILQNNPSMSQSPGQQMQTSPALSQQMQTSPALSQQMQTSPALSQQMQTSPALSQQMQTSLALSQQMQTSPALSQQMHASQSSGHYMPHQQILTSQAPNQQLLTSQSPGQQILTPQTSSLHQLQAILTSAGHLKRQFTVSGTNLIQSSPTTPLPNYVRQPYLTVNQGVPPPNRTVPFTGRLNLNQRSFLPSQNISNTPINRFVIRNGQRQPINVQPVVISNPSTGSAHPQQSVIVHHARIPYGTNGYLLQQASNSSPVYANGMVVHPQSNRNQSPYSAPSSDNQMDQHIQLNVMATPSNSGASQNPQNTVQTDNETMYCAECTKVATLRCKQCVKVAYCNANCAKTYWHRRHKMECKSMAAT